jgi:hypothetical protein
MDFPPSKMLPIERRIEICRRLMVVVYKKPHPDKHDQQREIKQLTQMFRALLTQKARQETIHNICNDYGRNTQNTGTGKTDNSRPGICARDILKKKISRCG